MPSRLAGLEAGSAAKAGAKRSSLQPKGMVHSAVGQRKKGFKLELSGQRFGRLVAVRLLPDRVNKDRMWECQCDCGKTHPSVSTERLTGGLTRSCGCLHLETMAESRFKHGFKHESEYHSWQGMKERCFNSKNRGYKNYGGRGITVCNRWRNSFKNFISDMGRKPTQKHSIDRKNNNGNYTPKNCRWATKVVQANNTRRSVILSHNGKSQTIKQWSSELGLNPSAVSSRKSRGMSVGDILNPKHFVQKISPSQVRMVLALYKSGKNSSRSVALACKISSGSVIRIWNKHKNLKLTAENCV